MTDGQTYGAFFAGLCRVLAETHRLEWRIERSLASDEYSVTLHDLVVGETFRFHVSAKDLVAARYDRAAFAAYVAECFRTARQSIDAAAVAPAGEATP